MESELRGGILISFAYMKNEPNIHPKNMIFTSKKQSNICSSPYFLPRTKDINEVLIKKQP